MSQQNNNKHGYSSLKGFHRAVPIILFALGAFFGLCFITQNIGVFGKAISHILLGLFSWGAYVFPLILILHGIFYPSDLHEKRLISRIIFSAILLITVSSLAFTISYWNADVDFSIKEFYINGQSNIGGGAIGSTVAYGIIKVFGDVGLIIIACVAFALYITYFFAKGQSSIRKFFLTIAKGIVSFFAKIEKSVHKMIVSIKEARAEKKKRVAEEKSQELYEDEFFDVDNGMKNLTITQLGIEESKPNEPNSSSALHEKVFPKSAVNEESFESETDFRAETNFSENENSIPTKKRVIDTTYGIQHPELFDEVEETFETYKNDIIVEQPKEDVKETPKFEDIGLDRSADEVFTKDFDPFENAIREELYQKPSSKSVLQQTEDRPTVKESLDDITEEDIKKKKRQEEFERRRQELIRMRKQNQPEKVEPAKVNEEAETDSSLIGNSFGKSENSNNIGQVPSAPSTDEKETDREETFEERVTATVPQTEKISDFGKPENLENTAFEIYNGPFTKEEPPKDFYSEPKETKSNEPTEEVSTAKEEQTEANNSSSRGATYERVASIAIDYLNNTQKVDTPPYHSEESTSPISTLNEKKECDYISTSFGENKEEKESEPQFKSFEIPKDDTEEEEPMVFNFEDEKETLNVERTSLYNGNDETDLNDRDESDEDVSDLESDANELESVASEDDIEIEEIPEEQQNPDVKEYRGQFDCLRDDDNLSNQHENAEKLDTDTPPFEIDNNSQEEVFEGGEEENVVENEQTVTEEPIEVSVPVVDEPKKEEKKVIDYSNYQFPPLDFLGYDEAQNEELISEEIEKNKSILIETLQSFNVTASIKGVDRGPRITRYEVVPARGVKVQQITNLFNDIALNLAAEGIRMEAPIPGKSAIGFEIPNKHPTNVRIRELLECEEFISAESKTYVCMGKDVGGNPIFGDIAKFPHCLVAGATGMGKSVCINSMIVSLLYKARPDEVKFIMIDPKKVEFKIYSGIPHLLVPVVTEPKQAAGALMWACEEMERRYNLIEELYVRNIDAYNKKVANDPSLGEKLPKIVIIIDELNDLMLKVRDPVEDLIMNIAQKARAAGIHLIIGTQRPEVKVITGTIKANINTRVACKVSSNTDSRTILDMAGAEKLLSKGDMLYKPTDKTDPIRVQGSFVSDGEIVDIIKFIKSQCDGEVYDQSILNQMTKSAQKCGNDGAGDGDSDGGDVGYYNDQQFLDAVDLAVSSGSKTISTSYLQRKLSIGYGKAAKFIDQMEDIGIVSAPNGQKPREVLMTRDEWHEKLSRVNLD